MQDNRKESCYDGLTYNNWDFIKEAAKIAAIETSTILLKEWRPRPSSFIE